MRKLGIFHKRNSGSPEIRDRVCQTSDFNNSTASLQSATYLDIISSNLSQRLTEMILLDMNVHDDPKAFAETL